MALWAWGECGINNVTGLRRHGVDSVTGSGRMTMLCRLRNGGVDGVASFGMMLVLSTVSPTRVEEDDGAYGGLDHCRE
jgi:hypothetical protein